MRKITPLKLMVFQAGKLQADLAQASHMTESRLSRILNARAKPTEYEIKNLAKALGISRDELPA